MNDDDDDDHNDSISPRLIQRSRETEKNNENSSITHSSAREQVSLAYYH